MSDTETLQSKLLPLWAQGKQNYERWAYQDVENVCPSPSISSPPLLTTVDYSSVSNKYFSFLCSKLNIVLFPWKNG